MSEATEYEIYTPERIAEFLLNNSLDEEDYRNAIREVIALGVDPLALDPKSLIRDAPWQRAELYVDQKAQRTS